MFRDSFIPLLPESLIHRFKVSNILTLGAIALLLATPARSPAWSNTPEGVSPRTAAIFADTSDLLGSPDPLPLETEPAFPRLRFDRPVAIAFAPDGTNRLFVVEQHGVIHVFPNHPDAERTAVFLDIREVVSRDHNEEGLLGLAFHPRYKENGRFFVYYSTKPRASIVSAFRVSADNPNRADRDSEEILMKIEQPYGNHNGGSIEFGPDGKLYIGLGDGGSANDPLGHGQNLRTLLGSILRIDVDHRDPGLAYAVPKDNPFVGRGDGVRGEIWAYGLRNVWRLTFDRATGDLWVGDVGQNRYEEVDIIVRGGNYGWKLREGFHDFDPNAATTGEPLIDPVTEYFRHEGMSVTGGYVYRGRRLPEFYGYYFYADYVTGNIWALRVNDRHELMENRKVARSNLNIAAFGEDESGEMYLAAFDGMIHRLRRKPGDIRALATAFPRKLSETGLFRSVQDFEPCEAALPYDVNVPLWSDGAAKHRFVVLPAGRSVQFDPQKAWGFPVGAVLVKTFFLPRPGTSAALLRSPPRLSPAEAADTRVWRRLETRLLVHAADGWQGYTYVWNEEQTDAVLIDGAERAEFAVPGEQGIARQEWYFPSRSDCMACHTPAAGFVLGLKTPQMNRPVMARSLGQAANAPAANQANRADSVNQIAAWRDWGVFANPPAESPDRLPAFAEWPPAVENVGREELEGHVRAYLDSNCAMCHVPNGIVGRPDFRFNTPIAKAQLIGANPGQGSIAPAGSKLVMPGDPNRSELWHRVETLGARRMPPLASAVRDETATHLIEAWIRSLPPAR
ncbi:MAG: PQQ-dependent sugar dehydrogenase [Thermogutta sp.]